MSCSYRGPNSCLFITSVGVLGIRNVLAPQWDSALVRCWKLFIYQANLVSTAYFGSACLSNALNQCHILESNRYKGLIIHFELDSRGLSGWSGWHLVLFPRYVVPRIKEVTSANLDHDIPVRNMEQIGPSDRLRF